jgi:predicted nucleotidyltransferase
MNLNPKETMFGLPILKVRDVLNHTMKERLWGDSRKKVIEKVAQILKQPTAIAMELINQLSNENYIVWEKKKFPDEIQYELTATEKGRRFGIAKATAPITRAKASDLLQDLIERAKSINENPEFVFFVERIEVFGSYLTDKELLGDLDVGVKLERKYHGEQFTEHNQHRIEIAKSAGRTFNNSTDQINWPYLEVMLMLKARKRGLSIHDINEDEVFAVTETKVVYQFPGI